jgi:hypothetical protein
MTLMEIMNHTESAAHTRVAPTEKQLDSLLNKFKVRRTCCKIWSFDYTRRWRMKPINTFSSELLRKVSHSNDYKGMNSDQVFLSMSVCSILD